MPNYLGFAPSSIFSYRVDDGRCNLSIQGIGTHCFGDFYYPVSTSNIPNPWGLEINPNPPVMQFFYKMFTFDTSNLRIGLLVYLLVLIASAIFPFWHLRKTGTLHESEQNAANLLLISTPVLMALDRGSFITGIFAMCYIAIFREPRNQKNRINFLLIALPLFKPHLILLDLIIAFEKKPKLLIKTLIAQLTLFGLSFFLYPDYLLKSIQDYFRQTINYQSYVKWGSIFPGNLSIVNDVGIPLRILGLNDNLLVLKTVTVVALAIVISYKLIKHRNSITYLQLLTIIVMSIVFLPGTSFNYYLILLFLPIILGLRNKSEGRYTEYAFLLESKKDVWLACLSAAMLLIPWTIPGSFLLKNPENYPGFASVSICNLVGILSIHLLYLRIILSVGKLSTKPEGIMSSGN